MTVTTPTQTIEKFQGPQDGGDPSAVSVVLRPGEFSLHHINMVHCSGKALASVSRRVGVAIRYMAAHVTQSVQPRDSVVVVQGEDAGGLYTHETRPAGWMTEEGKASHAKATGAGSFASAPTP